MLSGIRGAHLTDCSKLTGWVTLLSAPVSWPLKLQEPDYRG
jgi:hypothetical protein